VARAGLKGRLRKAAGAIADKDLGQAYREALFERFDASTARPARPAPAERPWRRGGRPGRGGPVPAWDMSPPTAEGRAAAKRLAAAPEALPAALARYALADPTVLDDHLEDDFTAHGFGEAGLSKLMQEIIRLRLESEHLDSATLARHLPSCGFSTLLTDIDRAATSSGAPFLKEDVSLVTARSQWSLGFTALLRLAALEASLLAAKQGLGGEGAAASPLMRIKAERDALKRAIRMGTIWGSEGS